MKHFTLLVAVMFIGFLIGCVSSEEESSELQVLSTDVLTSKEFKELFKANEAYLNRRNELISHHVHNLNQLSDIDYETLSKDFLSKFENKDISSMSEDELQTLMKHQMTPPKPMVERALLKEKSRLFLSKFPLFKKEENAEILTQYFKENILIKKVK